MFCCIMVHCRSKLGAWKHAQRSFLRGYAAAPPDFPGDVLPPPPPPPFFPSVEASVPQVRWADLCEEEDDNLVDVPLTAKDISIPRTLSISALLDPSSAPTPSVSTQEDFTGLELPSINGDWNSFGLSLRFIIRKEKSTTSLAVFFGVRLRRWMRRRFPVQSDVCQAFYICDTGIIEDPFETSY